MTNDRIDVPRVNLIAIFHDDLSISTTLLHEVR